MKRYLAFYGSIYYPSGGMEDFIGDFDSKLEAYNHIMKAHNDEEREDWSCNWYQIYDLELKLIVESVRP